ncbi:MAG TPA: tannase/feruloyl esterase family alpha/beta hydrolase [Caulobacteraceae bacterium]|jgi:feruloyl esterase|nr:tannase/feruloyl esterase family alpha/beta hydrolase [Caulobacteraceae bacterium]
MKLRSALLGGSVVALAAAGAAAIHTGGRAVAAPAVPGAPTLDCAALAQTALPNARVTSAQTMPAGSFTPPGAGPGPAPRPVATAFCRVAVTLTPSADSDIKAEVWLPQAWNGKFMEVGNGGWSGSITYAALADALARGYASASTDTGHEGTRGTFAFQHPEKLIDFAYRAVHETALKGKALTAAYYGAAPRFSYWNGCSSGGKQGLKEVQQYPGDFDGVVAGAPANNWMRLQTQSLVANIANLPKGAAAAILGPTQFAILNKGVLDQCDAKDGLADRQVQDPRTCAFKAASLVCKPGQSAAECLTPAQAEAADKIYAPVKNPRTGALIYPGMPPGSEMTWGPVISRPWDTGADTYKVLFNKPDWDFYTLDLAKDVDAAEKADPGIMATTPDLSAFKARGGKIIQYHGWADPFIPTENSINYYESVVARQGGLPQTQDFHRLFLVPGMGHCAGAYTVDWVAALERWVEGGVAPDLVMAKRIPPAGFVPPPVTALVQAPAFGERPMCAYPAVAHYKGTASGEEPLNWVCQAGDRGARPDHGPGRLGAMIASK